MAKKVTMEGLTGAAAAVKTDETPKMTIQQYGQQWDKDNPAPAMRQPQAPQLNNTYNSKMEDILKQYEPKVDTEKQQKRERARRAIAAIGDGLSAAANMIGTTQGGSNVYDPAKSLSAQMQAHRDKMTANADEDRKTYNSLVKHMADKEMEDNRAKLNLYARDKEQAAQEYRQQVTDRNTRRKNDIDAYSKQMDDERQAEALSETKRHQAAVEEESKRHNSAMEAQGDERNAIAREKQDKENKDAKGVYPSPYGDVKTNTKFDKTELGYIIGEMVDAGCFGKDGSSILNQIKMGIITDYGTLLQRGMKTRKGYEIVKKHADRKNKQ